MAGVVQRNPPRLSIELFRAFYAMRPDEEQWQLIDGVAIMMVPPTVHRLVTSNISVTTIEHHAPTLTALQRLGLNLAPPVEHYDPEPDVAVIDSSAGQAISSISLLRSFQRVTRTGSIRSAKFTNFTRPAVAFSPCSRIDLKCVSSRERIPAG
jgi:hypothetical protein